MAGEKGANDKGDDFQSSVTNCFVCRIVYIILNLIHSTFDARVGDIRASSRLKIRRFYAILMYLADGRRKLRTRSYGNLFFNCLFFFHYFRIIVYHIKWRGLYVVLLPSAWKTAIVMIIRLLWLNRWNSEPHANITGQLNAFL